MDVWQERTFLRFGSVDRSDRLTLGAAFSFFQEAAISHAIILGVGRDDMQKNGRAWILSRLSVFMEKRPSYGDDVIIRSWPRGPEKLFCLRDYDISDSAGKPLVRGRSGWLVLDLEKRRPQRVEEICKNLPLNEGLNALLSGPLGLASRDNLVSKGVRQAAYSDIDFNGHVNNVRYVQWIQDVTEPEALDNAAQIRLDINYLGETMPGEKVEIFSGVIEAAPSSDDVPKSITNAFAYEGRREGQAVFRAELFLGSA